MLYWEQAVAVSGGLAPENAGRQMTATWTGFAAGAG